MGFSHINQVRDHSQTQGAARLVLWAIASRANRDGIAFPSRECLARDAAISQRNVARALKQIPDCELEVIKGGSPKGGKRQVTRYRILLGGNPQTGDNTTSVKHEATGDKSGNDRCPAVTSTGDKNGKRPVSWCHPNRKANKNLNRKANRNYVAKSEDRSHGAASFTKKQAYVLSNKPKARKPLSQDGLPWQISHSELEELQDRFSRVGDVRNYLRDAATKCATGYPGGGPMRKQFFCSYLTKLEAGLDPPGLVEGQRLKALHQSPAAIGSIVEALVDRVQPRKPDSERNISVPKPAPQQPAKPPQQEAVGTDHEAQLAEWKDKCPELTIEFERIAAEVKSQNSEWNSKQFNRRCGELFDQHIRQVRVG
jgi:hypothetical protein